MTVRYLQFRPGADMIAGTNQSIPSSSTTASLRFDLQTGYDANGDVLLTNFTGFGPAAIEAAMTNNIAFDGGYYMQPVRKLGPFSATFLLVGMSAYEARMRMGHWFSPGMAMYIIARDNPTNAADAWLRETYVGNVTYSVFSSRVEMVVEFLPSDTCWTRPGKYFSDEEIGLNIRNEGNPTVYADLKPATDTLIHPIIRYYSETAITQVSFALRGYSLSSQKLITSFTIRAADSGVSAWSSNIPANTLLYIDTDPATFSAKYGSYSTMSTSWRTIVPSTIIPTYPMPPLLFSVPPGIEAGNHIIEATAASSKGHLYVQLKARKENI